MTTYLRSSLTLVWIILTSVTFASWWIGSTGVALGVIAIAIIKMSLVIWHFMEVRSAPAWLRWNCSGWLLFLALMLSALYRLGTAPEPNKTQLVSEAPGTRKSALAAGGIAPM